jgi:methyl-accepting chemotaxis protein
VKQNADNAEAANQLAMSARNTAERGGSVVQDAVAAVSRIEESARKISDIVGLIDEIAFQTNLLALNASVEAARAGEAGKGFAVVAQEVRALAQRSANASKDIKALIQASTGEVREGARLVNLAGESLSEIVTAVKKVADIVGEISSASREQAVGLEEVNTAVANMDEMTQRNGALVEQTTASAQAMARQAQELAELVGQFRV